MDQQQAINMSRDFLKQCVFKDQNIDVGTLVKVDYHPEGGKSLENYEKIRDYESILDVPYWEITFYSAITVIFENGRALLVKQSTDILWGPAD